MDGSHFDALTRSLMHLLNDGTSRRGLTRFFGAVALSGPLAFLGLAETEAKKKGGKKGNGKKGKKKGKKKKGCPGSLTRCGLICVNVQIDERHCGACNTPCAENQVCNSGVCRAAHCFDGVLSGDETDVDCGGSSRCARCAYAQRCAGLSDCQSLVCVDDGQGSKRCAACGSDAACAGSATPFCARICDLFPECLQYCVECRQDGDCPAAKSHCDHNLCVECLTDAHCTHPDFPACVNRTCKECHTNAQCTDPEFPRCDDGFCLGCESDADCPTGHVCEERQCVPSTCGPDQEFCDPDSAGCNGNPNCGCAQTLSGASVCGDISATCVTCSVDSDCDAVTGSGSACIHIRGSACPTGGCPDSNNRGCVAPCPTSS